MFALAFLTTRSAGSPLIDRYGGALVARLILVVETAGLVVLASAATEPAALAGAAVTGVGLGLVYPSMTAVTLQRTMVQQAGVAVGTMTSFWDLGILAAGPIGGLIATGYGYGTAFTVAAGMAMLALAITVILRNAPPTQQPPGNVAGNDRTRTPATPGNAIR